MAHQTPYWPWCAQPGAGRTTTLQVDQVDFGDGYVHRLTRGLNPVRPSWSLQFPFTSLDELNARDQFLRTNGSGGFWFTPPDGTADVFVYVNGWSASVSDRSGLGEMLGTINVTMVQCFNPQPQGVIPS
jgi:phage-related protein